MDWSNTTWNDKKRETFERDGSALILKVGIEMAVNIKTLAYECYREGGGPNRFDDGRWSEGLAQLLGYHLPPLQFGETYKMVIVK